MGREYARGQEPTTQQKSVDTKLKTFPLPEGHVLVTQFSIDQMGNLHYYRKDGSLVKVG